MEKITKQQTAWAMLLLTAGIPLGGFLGMGIAEWGLWAVALNLGVAVGICLWIWGFCWSIVSLAESKSGW